MPGCPSYVSVKRDPFLCQGKPALHLNLRVELNGARLPTKALGDAAPRTEENPARLKVADAEANAKNSALGLKLEFIPADYL